MDLSKFTLLTATFNRHDFTVTMLKSFVAECHCFPKCVILDNSTINPFPDISNKFITVVDNTNFKHTPDFKQPSKNHCSSINYALQNLIHTKYCILCDNDVLFKPSVTHLFDQISTHNIVGEVGYDRVPPARLYPYFCIIDMDFVLSHNIQYFDNDRCMVDNAMMDTGYSFWEDCKTFQASLFSIKLSDYVIHLKGGTLHNRKLGELMQRKSY